MSDPNVPQVFPHADLPIPPSTVDTQHPFKHKIHHQKLLEYALSRLELGRKQRDKLKTRYRRIDRQYAAWMKLDSEDQKRKNKQEETGRPLATQLNLPLMYVHLEDMLTYFMQVFAPTKGMYHAVTQAEKQDAANTLVALMNTHNVHSGHYRGIIMACAAALRYNLGGLHTFWDKEKGSRLTRNDAGTLEVDTNSLLWEGNRVEALDPYNTLMDPRVHPLDLHKDGEFCATIKTLSFFRLQTGAVNGVYFNTKDLLSKATLNPDTAGVFRYFVNAAEEVGLDIDGDDSDGSSGGTNWLEFFGLDNEIQSNAFEIINLYIWLHPIQMHLIPSTRENKNTRNRLEQWRITIINGDTIVQTQPMNNVHNWLPFSFGLINDDSMGIAQRSVGEIIDPLQNFGSFSLNAHIQATRKNIFGLTVYDPDAIEFGQVPEGEVAARIALKPAARGRDIRTIIWQNDNLLDTRQTTANVDLAMGLLNDFFPTQQLPSQVAGIDRAIESQVATVVQGSNRRQQKAARSLDASMLKISRFIQFYNIIQFQPDTTLVDELGKEVSVKVDQLRDSSLQYLIGQGLKSIDREAAAESVKELFGMVIQSPAIENVDVLGVIDYIGDLQGFESNLSQFTRQPATTAEPGTTGNSVNAANPEGSQGGLPEATGPLP